MGHRDRQKAQERVVALFHEVAALPGYEPVDEDTAIALIGKVTDGIEAADKMHAAVLTEIERLTGIDPSALSQEGKTLTGLAVACEQYEKFRFPMKRGSPGKTYYQMRKVGGMWECRSCRAVWDFRCICSCEQEKRSTTL